MTSTRWTVAEKILLLHETDILSHITQIHMLNIKQRVRPSALGFIPS